MLDIYSEAREVLSKKKSGNFIILKGNQNVPNGVELYDGGAVLTQDTNTRVITTKDLNNVVTKNMRNN